MADLSEFEAFGPAGCKTCRVRGRLGAEQLEKLEAALRAPHIGTRAIASVLTRWGHPVSKESVRHHRERCLA